MTGGVDSRWAARRWADTWRRCWIALDPHPIAALYAPSASYATAPFRPPHVGPAGALEYLGSVLAEESDVRAWFSEPIVDGDRAAIQWWASFVENGEEVTYAGTSILRFDADGLVSTSGTAGAAPTGVWSLWPAGARRGEHP